MKHIIASTIILIVALIALFNAQTKDSLITWIFVVILAMVSLIVNYIRLIKQTKNHDDD